MSSSISKLTTVPLECRVGVEHREEITCLDSTGCNRILCQTSISHKRIIRNKEVKYQLSCFSTGESSKSNDDSIITRVIRNINNLKSITWRWMWTIGGLAGVSKTRLNDINLVNLILFVYSSTNVFVHLEEERQKPQGYCVSLHLD